MSRMRGRHGCRQGFGLLGLGIALLTSIAFAVIVCDTLSVLGTPVF